MIDYRDVIQKIKEGDFLFRDEEGDTLLHSLAYSKEALYTPIEPVLALLTQAPDLADTKNKSGMTPADILSSYQINSKPSNRPFKRLLYEYSDQSDSRRKLEKSIFMSFVEHLPESSEEACRDIPSSEVASVLKRPTLLLFPGRGNHDMSLIIGFGRLMQKSLGIYQKQPDHIQVLSVRYPGNQRDLCSDFLISKQSTERQWEHSDHPLLYIKPFVEKHMRPLYLTPQGRKLPVETVMKNMRMLNLIGYSYGSTIIQSLSGVMREDMQENGFKKAEVALIQKQILAFSIGPALNRYHYQSGFRTFHLLNTKDDVVGMDMMELLPNYTEEKQLIKTYLKKDKNQSVLLINTLENNTDYPPHHINAYCKPANEVQKLAIMWMNTILWNGLDNSVQNAQSDAFIPLSNSLDALIKREKITAQANLSQELYQAKLVNAAQKDYIKE